MPTGEVPEAVFAKLCELLVDPWQPVAAAGRHACEFCPFTGGPSKLEFGTSIRIGISNLFVPGPDVAYVAPSLIVHCIDAHEYAPPAVFQEAVLACPPMRSMAYLREIKDRGLLALTKPPV